MTISMTSHPRGQLGRVKGQSPGKNERSSDSVENWHTYHVKTVDYENDNLDDVTPSRSAGEGLEPSPPVKIKGFQIELKIGTWTKSRTANPKMEVPRSKNGPLDHTHTPPLKI